jgi:dsRNA-specific ribonuclease
MTEQEPELYLGSRGEDFTNLIKSVLCRGNLKKKYLDVLLDEQSMKLYGQAFTHSSIDEVINYEFYELLGDATIKAYLVWYFARRFPQLRCPFGVKIVSRLKMNHESKESLQNIGLKLGFWDFVSAGVEERGTSRKDMVEDVVEAFIGVTKDIVDTRIGMGAGQAICDNILKSIFDEIEVSLAYVDLFDSKTILKEIFDVNRDRLGKMPIYENSRNEESRLATSMVYSIVNGRKERIGVGSAAKQVNAQKNAAKDAIRYLKQRYNIYKEVPEQYKTFCG